MARTGRNGGAALRRIVVALTLAAIVAACGATDREPAEVGSPTAPTPRSTSTSRSTAPPPGSEPSTTTGLAGPEDSTVSISPTTANSVLATTSVGGTSTQTSTTAGQTVSPTTEGGNGDPIAIRLRLDRRADDAATEGFAVFVQTVLTDDRGWRRAGFDFSFDQVDFDYTVILAEGPEVDGLCLPYDTFGRFSCQIGPVVALNADRWRQAVDSWPASLDDYRTMLVNHEVGHLLGQHHPASRCPGDGQPAPVMAQQSSGVAPCSANPWPLAWEIACAQQGVEPLAPPYERDITLTCGPGGPVG